MFADDPRTERETKPHASFTTRYQRLEESAQHSVGDARSIVFHHQSCMSIICLDSDDHVLRARLTRVGHQVEDHQAHERGVERDHDSLEMKLDRWAFAQGGFDQPTERSGDLVHGKVLGDVHQALHDLRAQLRLHLDAPDMFLHVGIEFAFEHQVRAAVHDGERITKLMAYARGELTESGQSLVGAHPLEVENAVGLENDRQIDVEDAVDGAKGGVPLVFVPVRGRR